MNNTARWTVQKGLPRANASISYLLPEGSSKAHVWQRALLRPPSNLFCSTSWSETLLPLTDAPERVTLFVKKLIYAAENFDLRSNTHPKTVLPYQRTHYEGSLTNQLTPKYTNVAAFFSKTFPPPCHGHSNPNSEIRGPALTNQGSNDYSAHHVCALLP